MNESDYSNNEPDYVILGLKFFNTCVSYPEQYDVYKDDKQVGYIRLRGGNFKVDYPDVGGKTILNGHFENRSAGSFQNEAERLEYLNLSAQAILKEVE